MKKTIIILLLIILFVAILITSCDISKKTLSEYMISCGQNKVYTPKGIADSYFDSNFGTKVWMFHLDDKETKEVTKYIDDFPELWHKLDNNAFSFIMYKFVKNSKIDLTKLSNNSVYYSLIDLYSLEFIEPHETIYDKYAVFIFDYPQNNYYCIKMSEK